MNVEIGTNPIQSDDENQIKERSWLEAASELSRQRAEELSDQIEQLGGWDVFGRMVEEDENGEYRQVNASAIKDNVKAQEAAITARYQENLRKELEKEYRDAKGVASSESL